MELRKLKKDEHRKTRKMWERIFAEDTQEFFDYYYSVKTAENEIYIIEENDTICAMLHLNPYQIQVGKQSVKGHYIVAVATDENYRRRGFMGKLLKEAQREMKAAGEAFTFLMPAAEGIYYPHGFRYIYNQKQGKVSGKKEADRSWKVDLAEKRDCGEIAAFANSLIGKEYEVFAKRDNHYYEVLVEEQASENGGIVLVRENEQIIGCFLYAKGEEYEIREPLFLRGYEDAFRYAVYLLTKDEKTQVKCLAYGGKDYPVIMAKILDIPQMFRCMEADEEVSLRVDIYDEPESEFLGRFLISGKGRLEAEEVSVKLEAATDDVRTEQLTIGMLTSLVFGYVDVERQGLTEHFKKEWKKIKPLQKVFLNEIV